MKNKLIIALLAIWIFLNPEIQAKEKPILKYFPIEGTSEVIQSNQAIAREQAINHALANTLESVLDKILKPATIAENYLILRDNFFSKSENYIQGYKVVSEKFDPREKTYKVSLNVNIFISDLRNNLVKLGLLFTGKKTEQVLIIIEEKDTEYSDNNSFLETLLVDKFTDYGISSSGRQLLKGIIDPKEMILLRRNDLRLLSFLRTQTDTDLIIWGETVIAKKTKPPTPVTDQTPTPEIEPEFESKGGLNIKIINTKNGVSQATKNEEVTISGSNEEILKILTLTELSENIAPFLIEEIRKIVPPTAPAP